MRPGGGRAKGSAFERLLAKKFEEWSGSEVRRTPLSGGWAKEAKFEAKGDLVSTDPKFPFSVEAKKQEGWLLEHLLYTDSKIFKWWRQCRSECPKGKIPLLVFSKNRAQVFVLIQTKGWRQVAKTPSPRGIKWMSLKTKMTGKCYLMMLWDFLKVVPYPRKMKKHRRS